MAKKKLLIPGGGYADIPLIEAAKELNFYVITASNRAQDMGHEYADEYYLIDYSDLEAMLELSMKLKIDAICAGSNDFCALTSAYVAEKLNLPGHDSFETSMIIHHKDKFRRFAIENNILCPYAEGFSDIDTAFKEIKKFIFPVIVKPVDRTGGKGISVLSFYNEEEIKFALQKAFMFSKAKRIVIENFITGTRHGFSSFIVNGKIKFYFVDNEHYFKNPFLVSGASTPSIVSEEVEKRLCLEIEKIISRLSLKDGIVHVQFIVHKNLPYIIEICRRSPGDLYTRFVEISTGFKEAYWIIRSSAGLDCNAIEMTRPKGFFTRHCIMSEKPGKLKEIIFDHSIERNIIEKFLWYRPGDIIEDYLTAKFGIVFLKFDSMEEMLYKSERMQELIKVITYN
ncbi:MAG: ATP-grasp domain-containing protein [Candidatus Omnitrophica bacterium]|nr:ATP-grasp domain-containing protein [Candidatus Omnitrophota bacterium]